MALQTANLTPSLWHDQVPVEQPRPSLGSGRHEVDVVIVGAGFSGLWTAYHLQEQDPHLAIMVLEAEQCGFGASGRNGGWCIAEMAASHARWTKLSDEARATALDHELHLTVDMIEQTIRDEGIDCDFVRGGELHLARNGGQRHRLQKQVDETASFWLNADEASAKCGASNVLGGLFVPSTAVLHPAKLVRSLAQIVERRGATIYEQTRVTEAEPGRVTTMTAEVVAKHVVLATEGYTSALPGRKRKLVPLNSMMIATEPLSATLLDEIRLHDRPSFADGRFVVVYGQRTADNRLAFGGRAAPYRFGSKIPGPFDYSTNTTIHSILLDLFPMLADTQITHQWGGVLGVPRNWTPSVEIGPDRRFMQAGGYVGEGRRGDSPRGSDHGRRHYGHATFAATPTRWSVGRRGPGRLSRSAGVA
ncbi:MAG: FAD-dependent oxidoreductase [Acidimicrobiales bacterium]